MESLGVLVLSASSVLNVSLRAAPGAGDSTAVAGTEES